MSLVRTAKKQDIPTGGGLAVECEGKSIALFNVEGRFHAVQGLCPHRGGPLAEGELQGMIVTCPWHAWRFDVGTGINADYPNSKIACFSVQMKGDDIMVESRVQQ